MQKKFIRFICNTSQHPKGEKIKALNVITKIYDNEENFLYVKKPHIFAQENQIEIDIEGIDYKKYLPLHYFKYNNGNIVKKSDQEIQIIENERVQIKEQKQIEQEQKEREKQDNQDIVDDITKTDTERLNALIKLYRRA